MAKPEYEAKRAVFSDLLYESRARTQRTRKKKKEAELFSSGSRTAAYRGCYVSCGGEVCVTNVLRGFPSCDSLAWKWLNVNKSRLELHQAISMCHVRARTHVFLCVLEPVSSAGTVSDSSSLRLLPTRVLSSSSAF